MGNKFTHIEVLQKDIDQADPKKSGRCVVATAIARCVPDATRIEVDIQTVRFTRDGERFVYVTPYPVTGYVVAFDRGESIHPFTFRLNETSRVGMKKRQRTPAGKAVTRAKTKVRDRVRVQQELELAAKDPSQPAPTKAEREVAKQRVEEALSDLESVTAAYGSQKKTVADTSEGKRLPPPRVHKTGRREYGHRVLAISQAKADS